MYKKEKTQRGITLIALVITIIVMLILVGVTISMAVNGGLFDYAGKAVGETQNALNEEQDLAKGGITIDGTYYNSIDEYLNQNKCKDCICGYVEPDEILCEFCGLNLLEGGHYISYLTVHLCEQCGSYYTGATDFGNEVDTCKQCGFEPDVFEPIGYIGIIEYDDSCGFAYLNLIYDECPNGCEYEIIFEQKWNYCDTCSGTGLFSGYQCPHCGEYFAELVDTVDEYYIECNNCINNWRGEAVPTAPCASCGNTDLYWELLGGGGTSPCGHTFTYEELDELNRGATFACPECDGSR